MSVFSYCADKSGNLGRKQKKIREQAGPLAYKVGPCLADEANMTANGTAEVKRGSEEVVSSFSAQERKEMMLTKTRRACVCVGVDKSTYMRWYEHTTGGSCGWAWPSYT